MSWTKDHLAPVEELLFSSDLVKVGRFQCAPDDPSFHCTEQLDNDLFVFPRNPMLVRHGAGDFRFQGPGGIALHRSGATVERQPVKGQDALIFWFGIHPEVFDSALWHGAKRYPLLNRLVPAEPRLAARIEWLLREMDSGHPDPLTVQNAVLDLLAQIRDHCSSPPAAAAGRERTRRRHRRVADATRRYIEFHLGEPLSLDQIAKAVGASPYHLCRIFREQTGITLHTYRNRQRLGRAIQVLINGHVESLTDLALDLGYSSHSHLTRAFRDELGVPPSALRSGGQFRPPIPVAAPFP